MKIAFLGDSITEGNLGVSFVDIIENRLPDLAVKNYGVGGDTVASLYKRIQKMDNLDTFDVFVLFIGINDVFGKLNLQHKLIKILSNQITAKNSDSFKKTYNNLLQYLLAYNKKILIIPPLLLGENLNNRWNQQVQELASLVKEQANFYKSVRFIDLRNIFVERLENKNISNYLPIKLLSIKRDVDTLNSDPIIDSKSKERGLHLTLDGVHINSIGANIIAREVIFELQRLK